MIEIKAKIHDKFSIEFKVGFVVRRKVKKNLFAINTWIFVPNSLDINPQTYGKDQFYRDVKSNVRLITPQFILRDIAGGEAIPLTHLRNALDALASSPTRTNIVEYEYQIKMFAAIFKSSLRNETIHIRNSNVPEDLVFLCDSFVDNIRHILTGYRSLRQIINTPTVNDELRAYFSFGDEFLSHITEFYTYRVVRKVEYLSDSEYYQKVRDKLTELIREEQAYKRKNGYHTVTPNDPEGNRDLIFRHGILKKYIESALYIKLNKKRDGYAVEQMYYSIAAGLAMIFATTVAFTFQKKFGNFTMPLFVALVVSYMVKDRIKELMRYYFAHRLGKQYFDNKASINIKEEPVGWIKEGVDFITDSKTPREVLELRNRSSLLKAENRIFDEKIILYRKLVYIDSEELERHNEYRVSGINDILRLHINRFTQKMDDPEVPLSLLTENDKVSQISSQKIYYLNIVMQFQYENQLEYKRFRIVLTRDGILKIQEMS